MSYNIFENPKPVLSANLEIIVESMHGKDGFAKSFCYLSENLAR